MAVPPSVPTILGGLAVFTTFALLAVHAILVYELAHRASSPAYTAAIAAIALEGAALIALFAHLASHVRRSRRSPPSEKQPLGQYFSRYGPWLLSGSLICTAAATISVLALVRLAKAPSTVSNGIIGPNAVPFLCGAAVTLGICYFAQLLFLATLSAGRGGSGSSNSNSSGSSSHQQTSSLENGYGKTSRSVSDGSNSSGSSSGGSGGSGNSNKHSRSSSPRVKTVPYSKTAHPASRRIEKTRPSRENGATPSQRAAFVGSLRLSLPHVIRPVTSKTRLLSPSRRDKGFLSSLRGGASPSQPNTAPTAAHELDTHPNVEDFDSWDTSAVDPQSRRTVLASFGSSSSLSSSSSRPTLVPANRFLETIPASPSASPSASRSPSPGTALDLPLPLAQRHRRRRSDSPTASVRLPVPNGTRTRAQSHSQSSQHAAQLTPAFLPPPRPCLIPLPPPPSEAHIHPLFRSDSPNPAPSVSSAGTVVTAAPNGGQVLAAADAPGLRTLNRMRSGSIPVVASPLHRQGSFDAWSGEQGIGGSRGGSSDGKNRAGDPDVTTPRFLTEGEDTGDNYEENDYDEETRRRVRADSGAERKMTPPIPEWILSAGKRRSLSGYQSRRERAQSTEP